MAGAGGAQQSGQPDNSMSILWGVAAVFIFGGVIWTLYKKNIVAFYFKIKLAEIYLISFFTNNLDDVRVSIQTTDPGKFTFQDVVNVGQAVGYYMRIPLVLIILVLACLIFFGSSTREYKRIYSMRTLAQLERVNWPQITPVVNLDLIGTDLDKGPWAMALTPMQFCKRFNLIDERLKQATEGMSRKERGQLEAILRRGDANKMFVVQLGTVWQGLEKLPIHARALFGIFAARINSDTKAAQDLLIKISGSSSTKLDFTGADELCKKHFNTKLVQEIVQAHAYVLTVMAAMLEGARNDGVQAAADFLWLKPVDRRLWYMLNSVGRQTPFVEVAGPFAHWIAEKEAGRKLFTPFVEEATNALEIALKEVIYKPEEHQ